MQPSENRAGHWASEESGEAGERRAHPRLQCKGAARIQVLPEGEKIGGVLLNLSLGGCCIETESRLRARLGTAVEVQLHISSFTVRQLGVICRIEENARVCIEFTEVSSRTTEKIAQLIAELFELEEERLASFRAAGETGGEAGHRRDA